MFAQDLPPPQQEEVLFVRDIHERIVDEKIQCHREQLSNLTNSNAYVLEQFDRLTSGIKKHLSEMDSDFPLSIVLEAITFAAEKHQGQVRKDPTATPYIVHPIGVAFSLWEEGDVRCPEILIAALLHDTLEDTGATQEEITALFGQQVYAIIAEVTNPPELRSDQAKQWQVDHAPYLSHEAKLVKLADRLYNVRDLRNAPVGWSEEKILGYYGWGQKLLDALEGTHPHLEKLLQNEIDANLVS